MALEKERLKKLFFSTGQQASFQKLPAGKKLIFRGILIFRDSVPEDLSKFINGLNVKPSTGKG